MVLRWRISAIGVYTDTDEQRERDVLGWVLTGGNVPPFTLRAEMFLSRWHRLLFVACTAVKATDGAVHPCRVRQLLADNGQAQGVAQSMAELMLEACEVCHPPLFALFAERAELRLRVMRLEDQVRVLRRELMRAA